MWQKYDIINSYFLIISKTVFFQFSSKNFLKIFQNNFDDEVFWRFFSVYTDQTKPVDKNFSRWFYVN